VGWLDDLRPVLTDPVHAGRGMGSFGAPSPLCTALPFSDPPTPHDPHDPHVPLVSRVLLPLLLLIVTACTDRRPPEEGDIQQATVVDSIFPIEEELRRFRVGLTPTDRLEGGATSPEALVDTFLRAIEAGDTLTVAEARAQPLRICLAVLPAYPIHGTTVRAVARTRLVPTPEPKLEGAQPPAPAVRRTTPV
jgi:hypothetical protein